ncbi:MAG: PIN domain-containing protein [Pontibacterium sp.]
MKWAFIDYENIGCLSKVDLEAYSKVLLFLGAQQPKIDFGDKKYDAPIEFLVVQVKASQANNLDFHLSYYLGKYDSETPSEVGFEIISNDNGFAPLIAHVKQNGRTCKQVKVPLTSAEQNRLVSLLTSRPVDKRPKKVTSLRNHIATQMGIQGNEVAIQNHVNRLVNAKLIKVSGEDINYNW